MKYLKESMHNFEKASDDIGATEVRQMIKSIDENLLISIFSLNCFSYL
jgi:hypothetical protein